MPAFVKNYVIFQNLKIFRRRKGNVYKPALKLQLLETSPLLQESREKLFQAMYKERLQPNQARMPKRVLSGLRRVCQDKRYAFMAPVEETVEHLPYLSCAVIYLPEGLFEMKYGIVFNERSPYVGIFRYTCVSQATWSATWRSGRGHHLLFTYQLLVLHNTE